MEIRIGTSGWSYSHWKDIFYPSGLAKTKWLEFYTTQFDTVELNATFYRLPSEKTFQNWYKRTPLDFLWSLKANRLITHIKKLRDVKEPLNRFYQLISGLKEKCRVILFQLPPSLAFEENLLKEFCSLLNPHYKYTLEIRHKSWINDKMFEMLSEHNIAFCISDSAGRFPYYEAITADFIYIRLHGPTKLYASEYSDAQINEWAEKLIEWGKDAFVYFDNDFAGYAVKNAKMLKKVLIQKKSCQR